MIERAAEEDNSPVTKEVIHISETEAAKDFVGILSRIRGGAEVVIESDAKPIAMIIPFRPRPGRLLSEAIAMAEARGSTVTLDEDFGRDLEDVIKQSS